MTGDVFVAYVKQRLVPTLKAGDVVVQRGTDHAWENRSDRIARMAFVLLHGEFSEELRARLPDLHLMP